MKLSRYIYIPFIAAIIVAIIYSILGNLTGSIVGDFIYGTVFGFAVLLYNDYKIRKIDSEGDEDVYKVRPTRKIVVFTNYENAFELCKESVETLRRGKIKRVDFEKGIIKARQGRSWHNSGNKIEYKLNKLTDVSTEIELKSASTIPYSLVDYGEGWKAIKGIAEFIDKKNHQMNAAHVLENKSIPTDVYSNLSKDKEKDFVK